MYLCKETSLLNWLFSAVSEEDLFLSATVTSVGCNWQPHH